MQQACSNMGSKDMRRTDVLAREPSLAPLLKASAPIPLGRLPGRFKVQLWRASLEQPIGISVGVDPFGSVVLAEDATHLGLRSGDEVLRLNGRYIHDVKQCRQIIEAARELEIEVYHRERQYPCSSGAEKSFIQVPAHQNCFPCFSEPHTLPVWCDPCFNPPESRCRAEEWPLRDLLLASMPEPVDSSDEFFRLRIQRNSQKQSFGIPLAMSSSETDLKSCLGKRGMPESHVPFLPLSESFSSTNHLDDDEESGKKVTASDTFSTAPKESEDVASGTATTVVVSANTPHLGLQQGDELLEINGVSASDLKASKAMLKKEMSILLIMRRNPNYLSSSFSTTVTAPTSLVGLITSRRVCDEVHSSLEIESSTKGYTECRSMEADFESNSWWSNFVNLFNPHQCCHASDEIKHSISQVEIAHPTTSLSFSGEFSKPDLEALTNF